MLHQGRGVTLAFLPVLLGDRSLGLQLLCEDVIPVLCILGENVIVEGGGY